MKREKDMSLSSERREELEKELVDRVKFVKHKTVEGEEYPTIPVTTANFELTEIGRKVEDLLKEKEYDVQYGNNDAWACIRSNAIVDAYQLAKKYGKAPENETVGFPQPVYELGVDLYLDGGYTKDENEDEMKKQMNFAMNKMKELADRIRALGVECAVRE